jgi:2-isopropylmalate synthase
MSDKVLIFDTTLRDGERGAEVRFGQADKIEIAGALAAAGVDVIEVGFPGGSQNDFEAVRAVGETVRTASVCALARANEADIDAASAALRGAAAPRIHLYVPCRARDEGPLRAEDEALAFLDAMIRRARGHVGDVEFTLVDATRADLSHLAEQARIAVRAGATTLGLADTVGCILPHLLAARIAELRALVPELEAIRLSFHGHDDLGLATANSLEAVRAGARQIEATVNGIGERAGNAALEEVVTALAAHGLALGGHTDVAASKLLPLSDLVSLRSGTPTPKNKAIVGKSASRHARRMWQNDAIEEPT